MAVTITITSPSGSELPLREWITNADHANPLVAAAGAYHLLTAETFQGAEIELRFASSGNDLTFDGSNVPTAGSVDSLEVYSIALGQVIATITGFSHSAVQLNADIFTFAAEDVDVNGGTAANFIFDDEISYTGDIEADSFAGGTQDDILNGGKGNDTLIGGFAGLVGAGSGSDTLNGGDGNDILIGGTGHNDGSDTLNGGDGDDILKGGGGLEDKLNGGDGFDTADYSDEGGLDQLGITVLMPAGIIGGDSGAPGDSYTSIEKFIGTKLADKFVGDGEDTQFVGGLGKDEISGGGGDDWVIGGADADIMDGGEGTDLLLYVGSVAGVTLTLGAAGVQTNVTGGDGAGDKIKNFENVIGGDGNDSITGNALNNRLLGFLGADTLKGAGGDDKLTGGDGKDTLDGGTENDLLDGGADADKLTGGTGIDTATYENSASAVTVNLATNVNKGGEAEGDKLFTVENVIGSDFDDVITGGTGDNVIEGGVGADTIAGTLNDVASYLNSSAAVQIDLSIGGATQTSTGDGNGDKLNGILNLIGSANGDKLTGNISNNVIEGGGGGDELDGGGSIDTLSYASSNGGVGIQLDTNGSGMGSGGHAQGDTYKFFENVTGSAFDDSLSGNSIVNKLVGGKGNDFFEGFEGADVIDGGDGIDGTGYENSDAGVTVNLSSGTNTGGHAQGDKLIAIEGVYASDFRDKLTGNTLANDLSGAGDDDYIDGGSGNDVLNGGGGIDTLLGNSGDDRIDGGGDADVMDGGAGIDTLTYSASTAVKVKLGEGSAAQVQSAATALVVNGVNVMLGGNNAEGDSVKNFENLVGSAFDDVLVGNSGINKIEGGIGKDNIDGGKGNDTIFGGFGNDTIFGGDGDDVIEGGTGADKLDGGLGKNTLNYAADTVGIDVDLSNGIAADGDAAGDTFINFQNVRGGSGGDFIVGDANANVLEGGGDADTLIGGGGKDTVDGGDTLFDTVSFQDATVNITVTLAAKGAVSTVTSVAGGPGGSTIKNVENVTGGSAHDTLTGNEFDNNLAGGNGDDILQGLTGLDNLFGGMGIDTAVYTKSNAGVTVWINGAAGFGQGGHAQGDGLVDIENLTGSNFADSLWSKTTAQSNTLKGGGGNDIIEGGAAGDMLFGEVGSDTLSYFSDVDGVVVTLKGAAAADVSGSVNAGNHAAGDVATGFENLLGGSGSDILTGDAAANVIDGGGMFDSDKLDGAGGVDTVSYATAVNNVTVTLGMNGAETTGNGIDGDNDSLKNFENIIGSDHHDILTGNNLVNVIFGGKGDDTLIGGGGADTLDGGLHQTLGDTADYSMLTAGQAITVKLGVNGASATVSSSVGSPAAGDKLINIESIKGGAGNDKLTGNGFFNHLYGSDGDDVLDGGAGADGTDTLDGGNGTDTASYASAESFVNVQLEFMNQGGAGAANADSLVSIENLAGSNFGDVLYGWTGVNVISGGAGNDVIAGGAGADILDGGTNTAVNVNDVVIDGDIVSYTEINNLNLVITLGNAGAKTIVTATGVNASVANGDEITNFEAVFASDGDDVLTGNSVGNALYGNNGNDTLDGGAGSDYLHGGNDIDTVSYATATAGITLDLNITVAQNTGGSGMDRVTNVENLIGSSKNDSFRGLVNFNEISGGAGNDLIEGGDSGDKLNGGLDNDTVSYEHSDNADVVDLNLQNGMTAQNSTGDANGDILIGFENLTGSSGFGDTLTGDGNVNIIKGLGGNDTIKGGDGADALDGGAGIDWLSYAGDTNAVTVTLGVNGALTTVTGLSHGAGDKVSNFENIVGGVGNDMLAGNSLANEILGGDGDDIIDGGAGDDILDGKGGTNTLSFASAVAAVTVNLFDAGATKNTGAGFDTFTNFHDLIGSAKNDKLTGNTGHNVIDGGAGDDTIDGGIGNDTLYGGIGNDIIDGGDANDTIDGGDGNDTINGGELVDTIAGGSGDDDVNGGFGNDIIDGDAGNDTIDGAGDQDKINGGIGNDVLNGGDGNDIVDGGDGNDAIDGGEGKDTISGGSGDDIINGSNDIDTIFGGAGNDKIDGGVGNDIIDGGAGNDIIDGGFSINTVSYGSATAGVTVDLQISGSIQATIGAGNDTLINIEDLAGSNFNDLLIGSNASQNIDGGAGADVIRGTLGVDSLTGGAGDDTFHYIQANHGSDNIVDFATGDTIRITRDGFGIAGSVSIGGVGANDFAAEYFVSGSGAVANKAHGQFIFNTDTFQLFWDSNGTGVGGSTMIADLTNNHNLLATDFTLV